MTETSTAASAAPEPKERLIVALDVASAEAAREIVEELHGEVRTFKIGLQLFCSVGPDLVRELTGQGIDIFLDLKFHDIPNTVAMAAVEAAKMGTWLFNVHAVGGGEMIKTAVGSVHEFCTKEAIRSPKMIGVTVLTSSDNQTLAETGFSKGVHEQVADLARLSASSGLDGVVASPNEVGIIRETVKDPGFLVITPGIRSLSGTNDDQRRVTTFARTVAAGANFVVVGRPVLQAADRTAAVRALLSEGN